VARVEMPWRSWHPGRKCNPLESARAGRLDESVRGRNGDGAKASPGGGELIALRMIGMAAGRAFAPSPLRLGRFHQVCGSCRFKGINTFYRYARLRHGISTRAHLTLRLSKQ